MFNLYLCPCGMFTVQHYEPLYGQQKTWLEFMQVQHFPEHFLRKCGTGCKLGGTSRLALIVSRMVRTLSVILDD